MSELKVGMRVRFISDVYCFPHTIVRVGETGTIYAIDLGNKYGPPIEVKLDSKHDLDEWDNCLHMTNSETDDQWPSIRANCIPI